MNKFFYIQVKRDFKWDYSYKISFYSQFFGVFLSAITLFFISKTFLSSDIQYLQNYNNNYFYFQWLA